MGVPRQRGKEDSLEKGPHSSSWPFQHTTHAAYNPGAICQEFLFSCVTSAEYRDAAS